MAITQAKSSFEILNIFACLWNRLEIFALAILGKFGEGEERGRLDGLSTTGKYRYG